MASIDYKAGCSRRHYVKRLLLGIACLVTLSLAATGVAAAVGETWTAQSAAEANGWQDVVYGNNTFVAVATTGTNRVMTSPDGITWTARAATEANFWNSVTYGNNTFVAVSFTGTNRVMTSPDGITWTARAATEANFWNSVTYGNNTFVAVSFTGTNRVMTSGAPPPPSPASVPTTRDFCATSGTIWGNPFSDVTSSNASFHADVGCVYNSGVIRGTTATTFSPDDVANREQVAVLIQRVMAVSGGLCTSRVPPWVDLASTSFAIGEVSCLYGSGLINGTTASTFSPAAPVTRAETAALVARIYRYLSTSACPTDTPPFTDTAGNWATADIACVYELGIDTGTTATTFTPGGTVTRAEMATILARTIRTLL